MLELPIAVALFIERNNIAFFDLWMQKRKEDGPLDGLWEFPGGKVEQGESAEQAMVREVAEEVLYPLNNPDNISFFKQYPYQYEDREILMSAFLIQNENLSKIKSGRWFHISIDHPLDSLGDIIPQVNGQVIEDLAFYLKTSLHG